LMFYRFWSAGARDAVDGRSVFSKPGGGTRVREQLATLPVTLFSDPHAPGVACAPFVTAHASGRESSVFDNGLPLSATDCIRDGRLQAPVLTRYSAGPDGPPVAAGLQ